MYSLILSANRYLMNKIAGKDQITFVAAARTAGHESAESSFTGERKLGLRDILDVAYTQWLRVLQACPMTARKSTSSGK
jgi:hypothetical protein